MPKLKQFSLFVLFVLIPVVVHAQNCDSLVDDGARVFKDGRETETVEEAARQLVNSGADVRVKTILSIAGYGNLDIFEKELERSCPSWQDGNGSRKNNLIVLMIARNERKTGLYYGSQWNSALDTAWQRIQRNNINPRFKNGDFAGGFAAGLNEIKRLVDFQLQPPLSQPTPEQKVIVQEAPSQPVDLSGLWKVLGWLLGLAALAAVIIGAFRLYAHRQRRQAAQRKAIIARQAAASRINELPNLIQLLEVSLVTITKKVSDSDAKPLLDVLVSIKSKVERANVAYSDLGSASSDPSQNNLSEEDYGVIEQAYQKIADQLYEVDELRIKVEQQINLSEELIQKVPEKVKQAELLYARAVGIIGEVRSTGFKTSNANQLLDTASKVMAQAVSFLGAKRFKDAANHAEESEKLVSQAVEAAQTLSKRRQILVDATESLATQVESVKKIVLEQKPVFERISSQYAPSSWQSVKGNGTEATNRVNWAIKNLDSIRQASSMEKQEWDQAEKMVAEVRGWLDQAESLMHSITALEASLKTAASDAPKEIQDAQTDIKKAWDYINQYDDDIREELEEDLRNAETVLKTAVAKMKEAKLDYFEVIKLAKQANSSADKILLEAQGEHEAAERLRKKAASAIRDAESRVSKADEYIQDHSSDVGKKAKNYLKDATKHLQEAELNSNLNVKIALAEKADEVGKKAYKQAKSDVEDSYSSSPSRSNGGSTVLVWGTPSHSSSPSYSSSSSSGSSDSGGESSWSSSGSSDWGGGGSSSFDSGDGGGGGSSDW